MFILPTLCGQISDTEPPPPYSVCEDLVCVCYPHDAWLYRVRLGKGMVDPIPLSVIDLRSADGLIAMTRCCRHRVTAAQDS